MEAEPSDIGIPNFCFSGPRLDHRRNPVGLDLPPYSAELAALQVSHVTLTINAIDPEIGAGIYSWARYKKKVYRDIEAAKVLITKQLESLKKLKEAGITAKLNSSLSLA